MAPSPFLALAAGVSLALSGCVAVGEPLTSADDPRDEFVDPLVDGHVVWDGALDTSAAVCAPDLPCLGASGPANDALHALDAAVLVHANLQLAWEASSPATETLVFRVAAVSGCGPGCTSYRIAAEARGASPLHVEAGQIELGPGEDAIALVVSPVPRDQAPVALATPQAFHVEGYAAWMA